jgi:hypothetical protein
MLFDNPQHMQKRFVFIRKMFFKTSGKVQGDVKERLRSRDDLAYSFHGGSFLIDGFATTIVSGFSRLFYHPYQAFWDRINHLSFGFVKIDKFFWFNAVLPFPVICFYFLKGWFFKFWGNGEGGLSQSLVLHYLYY